jgi:hypothetical protein
MTTVNPRESLLPKLNMYHTILWMNQNSQKKKKENSTLQEGPERREGEAM